MYIADIIWLPKVIDKLVWKHSVSPEKVDEILFGNAQFQKVQRGAHSR